MMTRQMLRNLTAGLAITCCCLLAGISFAAETVYEVETRADVKVPMRDGVLLSANVFLPKATGKFPTVLQRTPYGKGNTKRGEGLFYATRGYVYVSQDCRGKGASAGTWTPFVNEASDGKDTHHWILDQPWSNGTIGTTGGSYVGFTQWISAPGSGEHVKAMFPVVPLIDPYDDLVYVGGAFQLSLMMGWGSATSGSPTLRGWKEADWRQAFRTLPLCTWDRVIGSEVQYLRDWVARPHFDEYWQRCSLRGRAKDITTPSYVICGWYDLFAKSVFKHVNAVRTTSRSPDVRRHQHILMGPWVHGISRDGKVGDLDFGKDAVISVREIQAKWFQRWLKDGAADVDNWPPLRIFVMGRNQWRNEQQWPLARTQYTPYYFHGRGEANTLEGDGTLNTNPPQAEPADHFVYDPHNPVPTLGGNNLHFCPMGPRDQTLAEQREDVLVFSSEPLTRELEVTGPVKVVLYAASSAPDTDWTAKLVDVGPDGRPINLCDGIVRARYRESTDKPTPITPGKIYRYEIDLWVTSNVFLPRHRVRVEISSSNFPRFDRNPNTGHPFGADAEVKSATQTVYHDAEHASHILLPVIP